MKLLQFKKPPSNPDKDTEALVKMFESYAESAKQGKCIKAMVIADMSDGYEYSRIGFKLSEGVGLCARLCHRLNKEWDE